MRVVAYQYGDAPPPPPPAGEGLGTAGGQDYAIDRVYADPALPTEPGYRPQLTQFMADNQVNPADVLVVPGLEVLGDTLEDIENCVQALRRVGTAVVVTADGSADALVAEQRDPLASLEAGVAVSDRQRRRRLREGHARNRLKALPPPGKAPYGYRRGQERYLIDRTAAPVITAFVNEFLLYGSLRGAVRFVEARFGKRIAVSTGRRWLTHPAYRGDLQYQDGQVMRDTHAAIISRDEAAQIDRLLRRNSKLPPRTAGAPRSLAGLVSCQTCGMALVISKTSVRGQNKHYLYLRPVGCPQVPKCRAIPYDEALQKIITQICQTLPQAVAQRQPILPPGVSGPPQARFQDQIEQRAAILAQLPNLVETGVLDPDTAALRRYKLRGELADLQQRLAQLPPVNLQELAQSVSIPQFWLDLSEAERRFFFREFIRDIRIIRQGEDWGVELMLVF
ncbi:MAG: recombinase family protein [Nodosilinea sp.]